VSAPQPRKQADTPDAGKAGEEEREDLSLLQFLRTDWFLFPRQDPASGYRPVLAPLTDAFREETASVAAPAVASPWTSFGPANISGRIKSLVIHPVNGDILYAGSAGGGVWQTEDGGGRWTPRMEAQDAPPVGALAISASDPNILYAATGENTPGFPISYPGSGVYRTTDGGKTWQRTRAIPIRRPTRVLVHPKEPERVYVAGEAGLYMTERGGDEWQLRLPGHISDVLLDTEVPELLFAALWKSGVYRSHDGGGTWDLLHQGLPTGEEADWIKLAIGPRSGDTSGNRLLLAKMGVDSGFVFRSRDGGDHWEQVERGGLRSTFNEWANVIAIDPTDPNLFFAGGPFLARSVEGGLLERTRGTHVDHHQIVFHPSKPEVCFVATDGGVYRSERRGETNSWQLASGNLVTAQFYSIGLSQEEDVDLVGGATQDQGIIFTRDPNGEIWIDTDGGHEGGFFVVAPPGAAESTTIFIAPAGTELRRSVDGGAHWNDVIVDGGGKPITHLAVRPDRPDLVLCARAHSIFQSMDGGQTWRVAYTTPEGSSFRITRLAFSPSHPETCYAVATGGRVFRSENSGSPYSWSEPTSFRRSAPPPRGHIAAVAVAPDNPGHLYIGYSRIDTGGARVYMSKDEGMTWLPNGGDGLPETVPVNDILADPTYPGTLFVATDFGVFATVNDGAEWSGFNAGMPRVVVTAIALRQRDRMLFVSTMGRGMFRRPLT
jgi:photosystem II stability/assembly factor-like uncharacterized protein